MKKFILFCLIIFLSGCGINQSVLNIGTDFQDYESACRKAALVGPKLIYNDGRFKGYTCEDGTGATTIRYEFFENNKLIKVWSRPISAEERMARINSALLGIAILNSGNSTTAVPQSKGFYSFDIPSGLNKICFYNYLGSLNTRTIGRAEVCPLN